MEGKERYQLTPDEEKLAQEIVDCSYAVHSRLGPGLLEHVYEVCFCHELQQKKIAFQRQIPMSLSYDGIVFDEAFRLDVLVEDLIICEIKAVRELNAVHQELNAVHQAQVLTYMRLTGKRIGFAINFHTDLIKNGIRRLTL